MVSKLCVVLLLLSLNSFASQKYLLFLHDKGTQTISEVSLSKESLDRRTRMGIPLDQKDIPVNPVYLSKLQSVGKVIYVSRWLNAVSLETKEDVLTLQSIPFVDSVLVLEKSYDRGKRAISSINKLNYGLAEEDYEMMDIPLMHELGLRGEGIKIAVFDSGFEGVDQMDVFNSTTILGGYNFVTEDSNVYQSDDHGTYVFSVIGSNKPGELIGTAFDASFYLFVTEDVTSEGLEEEFNWLIAAEKSDSIGVDIISSSLSYTTFDNTGENHKYSDLDGKTTIITMAAAEAANKGILVVNSVGNEGNSSWYYLAAPADADSILAVGSVNSYGNYASFSSKGPSYDGRIKPDVVCQGVNIYVADKGGGITTGTGTSFSAPQITGLCAGVMNLDSTLTNMDVIEMVKSSASIYENPDNFYGYGIPSFTKLLNDYFNEGKGGVFIRKTEVYPNPIQGQVLRLFVEGSSDLGKIAEVALYHSTGVQVYKEELVLKNVITPLSVNMGNYSKGMYFVKVKLSSGEYTHQLIKM